MYFKPAALITKRSLNKDYKHQPTVNARKRESETTDGGVDVTNSWRVCPQISIFCLAS